MSESVEPTYPIFLLGQDNWIYKYESLDAVHRHLEYWFVEDGETKQIWDIEGKTYSIHCEPEDKNRFYLTKTSDVSELDKLRNALLDSANANYSKEKLIIDKTISDPSKIYDLVEAHLEKYSLGIE